MADRTDLERAIERAFRPRRRLSRRMFLRQSGRGIVIAGSALSLPAILAACGIDPGSSPSAGGASQAALPSAPAGVLDFANWPAYIDIDEETGGYPTLDKFTEEIGHRGHLHRGDQRQRGVLRHDPAGSRRREPAGLRHHRHDRLDDREDDPPRLPVESSTSSKIPNFDANALDLYKDPWYDPGNVHSMAWQSGHHRHRLQPDAHRPRDHDVRRPPRPRVRRTRSACSARCATRCR